MLQKRVSNVPNLPAPTQVTSFFAKFLMVMLMRSNEKRVECRIGVDMGRFTPGTHQPGRQKLYKDSEHLWLLVLDTLNTHF